MTEEATPFLSSEVRYNYQIYLTSSNQSQCMQQIIRMILWPFRIDDATNQNECWLKHKWGHTWGYCSISTLFTMWNLIVFILLNFPPTEIYFKKFRWFLGFSGYFSFSISPYSSPSYGRTKFPVRLTWALHINILNPCNNSRRWLLLSLLY